MSDKPIKHIEVTRDQWIDIRRKLMETYGPSIVLSWKMKEICGFTMREHHPTTRHDPWKPSVYCLDFYSEDMKTWYLLQNFPTPNTEEFE
jgi:hypothetical protein